MTSGVDLILQEHALVRSLFDQFSDDPRGEIAGRIFQALAIHDQAEHAALYPLADALLNKARVLERYIGVHATIKALIDHARTQEGAALVDAIELLRVTVMTHVEDEEKNLLPALEKKATPEELDSLGTRITQNEQRVG